MFYFEKFQNFESYQTMLNILDFNFLHNKLQLCSVCYVHYTSFTWGQDYELLKFWDLKFIFKFKKIKKS
jgi:hypothetical protein